MIGPHGEKRPARIGIFWRKNMKTTNMMRNRTIVKLVVIAFLVIGVLVIANLAIAQQHVFRDVQGFLIQQFPPCPECIGFPVVGTTNVCEVVHSFGQGRDWKYYYYIKCNDEL